MFRSRTQMTPIGVELGSHHLKLVQLTQESNGRFRLVHHAVKPWPFEWRLSGDDTQRHAIHFIKDMIRSSRLAGRRAIVTLPDSLFEYNNIRVSGQDQIKIIAAVHKNTAEQLSLETAQVRCQFFDAGGVTDDHGGERREIITMAAPVAKIDSFSTLLASAGVEAVVIDVSSHAIAHLLDFLTADHAPASRLIINLGHRWTNIVIVGNAGIQVIRRLPVGLITADLQIADALRVGVETAEGIRHAVERLESTAQTPADWPYRAVAQDQASQAVTRALTDLATRIGENVVRCGQYFGITFRQDRPETAVLTGGGAAQAGLSAALTRSSGVQCCTIAELLQASQLVQTNSNQESIPWNQIAESIGLALNEQMPGSVRSAA